MFRIDPVLPAEAMQTYSIIRPPDTSIIVACKDAGCQAWRHGWETCVDERTDLGLAQATYIRQGSGRTFAERRTGAGVTVFRFEPYQRCFAEHRTRGERFIVAGGDFRGNPRGTRPRVHVRPDDWVEDFALNLDGVRTAKERG